MPFVLPTFNVAVRIWHPGFIDPVPPPVGVPALSVMANVSLGKRVMVGCDAQFTQLANQGVGIDVMLRIMMVPALTDVRGRGQGEQDIVEMPSGSGAFYVVSDVADMAKGFANEHRVAWLYARSPAAGYSLPVPLP